MSGRQVSLEVRPPVMPACATRQHHAACHGEIGDPQSNGQASRSRTAEPPELAQPSPTGLWLR